MHINDHQPDKPESCLCGKCQMERAINKEPKWVGEMESRLEAGEANAEHMGGVAESFEYWMSFGKLIAAQSLPEERAAAFRALAPIARQILLRVKSSPRFKL